jgi:hypothetical protein
MSILDSAKELVHNDRRKDYDHPAAFFARQASMFSAAIAHKLREPITAEEANIYMILFKLNREITKPKVDSRIDLAGYAETLDMIHKAKAVDNSNGPVGPEEYTEGNIKKV